MVPAIISHGYEWFECKAESKIVKYYLWAEVVSLLQPDTGTSVGEGLR